MLNQNGKGNSEMSLIPRFSFFCSFRGVRQFDAGGFGGASHCQQKGSHLRGKFLPLCLLLGETEYPIQQ
jgi:hypothetical protein